MERGIEVVSDEVDPMELELREVCILSEPKSFPDEVMIH
jgi:hypothetical protein